MSEQKVTTKAALMPAIEQSWAALQAVLARLTDAEMTTIHDAHRWTVKDHLVHMTYWARSVVFLLQGKPRHAGLDVDEALYLARNEDNVNAAIFQKHQALPLAEALAQFHDVHQQLITLLQALTDDDLQQPYRHYLPHEPGDGDGPSAIKVVYANSAHHFAEHLAWITALAGKASS